MRLVFPCKTLYFGSYSLESTAKLKQLLACGIRTSDRYIGVSDFREGHVATGWITSAGVSSPPLSVVDSLPELMHVFFSFSLNSPVCLDSGCVQSFAQCRTKYTSHVHKHTRLPGRCKPGVRTKCSSPCAPSASD